MSKLILLILTVASVFGSAHRMVEDKSVYKDEEDNLRVLFLGDIMLGRNVGTRIANGEDPFLFVHEELAIFDAVIGNLEGPITDIAGCQKKAYSFKFATTTASLLAYHNIYGVSLANNHSYDCYLEGLIDTREYLTKENILYFEKKILSLLDSDIEIDLTGIYKLDFFPENNRIQNHG